MTNAPDLRALLLAVATLAAVACTPDRPGTNPDASSLADAGDTSARFDAGDVPQEGCPDILPAEGSACTRLPGIPWCYLGTEACPAKCTCAFDGSHPDPTWHCVLPVGPGCAVSTCPASLPANQTSCGESRPDGPLYPGSGCRYVASACQCDCSDTGIWSCDDNCGACPATAPAQDAECGEAAKFARCQYGAAGVCSSATCECRSRPVAGAKPAWDCFDSCAAACPSSPPETGATCVPAHQRDLCLYTAAPYCGQCVCGADGVWKCSDSSCDECPAAKPTSGQDCAPANEQCAYPDRSFCECTADGGRKWACR